MFELCSCHVEPEAVESRRYVLLVSLIGNQTLCKIEGVPHTTLEAEGFSKALFEYVRTTLEPEELESRWHMLTHGSFSRAGLGWYNIPLLYVLSRPGLKAINIRNHSKWMQTYTRRYTFSECIVEARVDDWVECAVCISKKRGKVLKIVVPAWQLTMEH